MITVNYEQNKVLDERSASDFNSAATWIFPKWDIWISIAETRDFGRRRRRRPSRWLWFARRRQQSRLRHPC